LSIGDRNDASYAHARLRRDRPDIHARVLAGEISAHGGMKRIGGSQIARLKFEIE
jgi:hypothetical protein